MQDTQRGGARWSSTRWICRAGCASRPRALTPDLLRAMVKEMAEALMSADAEALCGAGYGERSPERVNRRNGYRDRDWDTGWLDQAASGAEAQGGQLPPGVAAAAAPARRAGVRVGDRGCLSRRRLDPSGGEAGAASRRRADQQEPGLPGWRGASTGSSRTSAPARSTVARTPTSPSTRSWSSAARAAGRSTSASCTRSV